uniref:DUF4470 domain-containing protein n=1 Tax=Mucochytrium quahogii TaxID=96639 RepID=A0A7S2S719_9STRA|mmetsp:Transcript_28560/g.46032  ORF Transcript_28560/g.46032 Transcript_28560/m.46032 type:complete len:734 (+) Transcript_28560:38-2239(+)
MSRLSLARRKLFDRVMGGFCIGNTNARSLICASDQIEKLTCAEDNMIKILYVGVGDMRNLLTTLCNVPLDVKVGFTMNDVNTLVLARNVLIMSIAIDNPFAATSIWSDALISSQDLAILTQMLALCIKGKLPTWINVEQQTFEMLKAHWLSWLQSLETCSLEKMMKTREAAIRVQGTGHGRAGVSSSWREFGVASKTDAVARTLVQFNPTLYDFQADPTSPQFVECQGPTAAFAALEGVSCGGTAFSQILQLAWKQLFSSLRDSVKANTVHIHVCAGDCTTLLDKPEDTRTEMLGYSNFCAIDTSNLMDYVGLWNLLLLCGKCLDESVESFVFTEQIMGVANNTENMLLETIPHQPDVSRCFAKYIGLELEEMPVALRTHKNEKVVHARWRRHVPTKADFSLEDHSNRKPELIAALKTFLGSRYKSVQSALKDLWVHDLDSFVASADSGDPSVTPESMVDALQELSSSECDQEKEEEALFLTRVFDFMRQILIPQSLSPEMIEDVHKAVELSYPFPTSTIGTFVEFFSRLLQTKAGVERGGAALKNFFADKSMNDFPRIRNRTFGLQIQCSLRLGKVECERASFQTRFKRSQIAVFQSTVKFIANEDVLLPKGGILEPALSVFLVRSSSVLKRLEQLNGKWENSEEGPVNLVFEYLSDCAASSLQIIDNASFDSRTNQLQIELPIRRGDTPFQYFVLVDIQQYRLISVPQPLTALEPTKSTTPPTKKKRKLST